MIITPRKAKILRNMLVKHDSNSLLGFDSTHAERAELDEALGILRVLLLKRSKEPEEVAS